jgi:hypothetical protein
MQVYQEISSFFQTILDFLSNYFGPIFEDITAMSEQLPKKIKEEMINIVPFQYRRNKAFSGPFNF